MKTIFLSGGAREKALRKLLEQGEEIVGVIVPKLTTSNDRFANVIYTAAEFGVNIYPVDKYNLYDTIRNIEFDLLISCGFPFIIEKKTIELANLAINVHPTLLPKYRGYRSGPYIIINGEKESGVTIHKLEEEMDKGDILMQEKFEVSDFDTSKSVFIKAQKVEIDLLYNCVQKIKKNEIVYTKQDESKATTYNYIRRPKDSEIDPSKSLNELYNEIRACDPKDYPAFFYYKGEKVCVKLWRYKREENIDYTI